MASLKEVKQRIASVESTRKITVARQMISSAQLRRAQGAWEGAKNYNRSLAAAMEVLAGSGKPLVSPLSAVREEGAVAVVVMASNSGMCGAFNTRMIKELNELAKAYAKQKVVFYPIGKKIREALLEQKRDVRGDFDYLAGRANCQATTKLTSELIDLFLSEKIKQVELMYYHNKNSALQEVVKETLLPYATATFDTLQEPPDSYIFEPSREQLFVDILPRYLQSVFYKALTSHHTAEHAARTVAMQLASENAKDLLDQLRVSYNKFRQQNITSELLDIIGGSFA